MRTTPPRAGDRLHPVIAAPAILFLSLVFGALPASALTIDFEGLANGEVVTNVSGVTIIAESFQRDFDYAVAFDSTATGTEDSDLEDDWAGGNLVGEVLGNLLILQENDAGCESGVCSRPDDEGRRPAGTLTLEFSTPTSIFGFDLIDIDSAVAENGALTLWDASGASVRIDFDVVLAGLDIGDNTANRITPYASKELGLGEFVKAEFLLGGSGAIDNIEIVPEPTTALLMGLGLAGLGVAGRRRS